MSCVKPQLEKVPAGVPRQGYWGAGVLAGGGGGAGVFVGLGLGLGVLVGGTGVAVGKGVSVGGSGVKVGVGGKGVGVGVSVGTGVSVGSGVSVGMGVLEGVRVTVKVGLGVLVGVAVGSGWRARNVRLPMATMPAAPHIIIAAMMAITTIRMTTRLFITFITPLGLFVRWPTQICAEATCILSAGVEQTRAAAWCRSIKPQPLLGIAVPPDLASEPGDYTILWEKDKSPRIRRLCTMIPGFQGWKAPNTAIGGFLKAMPP
jgi:hypothetical protein